MTDSVDKKWRSIALVLAGVVLGQIVMGTAGAHIKSFRHLKAEHFFTKSQADARFLTESEADAHIKTRWAFLELDDTPRILKQTGGFSFQRAEAGSAIVAVGEDARTKNIQVTPHFGDAAGARAAVCGGASDVTVSWCGVDIGVDHVVVDIINNAGTEISGKAWVALHPA